MLFIVGAMTVPLAYAASGPQLGISLVSGFEIDLDSADKDRMVHTWVSFSNFDPSDKFYTIEIIQSETGNTVSTNEVYVFSTVDTPVTFGSFGLYVVEELDLCENEEAMENEDVENCNPVTGDYQMKISTRDGSVSESVGFSVIDTRN